MAPTALEHVFRSAVRHCEGQAVVALSASQLPRGRHVQLTAGENQMTACRAKVGEILSGDFVIL